MLRLLVIQSELYPFCSEIIRNNKSIAKFLLPRNNKIILSFGDDIKNDTELVMSALKKLHF